MHRGTALICDDDSILRSMVGRLLADEGWEVVASVETAIEALDLARVLHPDLVIMDVSLRGLSGVEAVPELVAGGAAVVVCSAFSGVADHAHQAGALATIDKSDLASLVAVLAGLPVPTPA
ncbi:MAG TPA: response regulator [Acidimicrobiales bacterium]|jgi:response regulator NasT